MDVDIQNDVQPKTPDDSRRQPSTSKADDEGDSWSDVSDEYSVVSDGGAVASAESTTEEGSKCNSDPAPFTVAKRRWTISPVKKLSSTIVSKRIARKCGHPRFSSKLATIFERLPTTATGPRKLSVLARRRHRTDYRIFELFRRAVNRPVEEVDKLMMNLVINQQNQAS